MSNLNVIEQLFDNALLNLKMTPLHDDGIPAWHRFELIVRDAIRPLLPRGGRAGLLMNRRLGHDQAAEADLLYAGTHESRNVVVIIECKNRPIEVSGSAILLPGWEGNAPINLMAQLNIKANQARMFLGFDDIRFLVVGCTRTAFSMRVAPDIFAVGQPIAKWSDPTAEQDFSPITSTWPLVVHDIEALGLDSPTYLRLRNLPRFTPWDTIEARELRADLEAERFLCEIAYLNGEAPLLDSDELAPKKSPDEQGPK